MSLRRYASACAFRSLSDAPWRSRDEPPGALGRSFPAVSATLAGCPHSLIWLSRKARLRFRPHRSRPLVDIYEDRLEGGSHPVPVGALGECACRAWLVFGVAPRSPTGLLQPAVGASGCQHRVTRHPAGHSCHCFRCAGGTPSSQATRQGALQRASVVAGSSRTSRSRRPGIQSQAWAGSPAIAVGFASVAQAGVGACRDCGGIGVVKERGSVAWPSADDCEQWRTAAALEVNLSAR